LLIALPAPNTPVPTVPGTLASVERANHRALESAIDRWKKSAPPPRDVTSLALFEQRIIRKLGLDSRLARAVLRRLPTLRGDVAARSDLALLGAQAPVPRSRPRLGRASPPLRLLDWYREAQTRFRVRWQLLAAINFVETAFGRVRSASTAGAQGPMQFEPATWRAYGLGGDINNPHDAILAAANYLAANGVAKAERVALFHYNPSRLYVDAIERYAHRIANDHRAFFEYYNWQVYFRTATGSRRVTGPP
jgi:soluble lytic murein transglycosylase-like protein